MMKYVLVLLCALLYLAAPEVEATCTNTPGSTNNITRGDDWVLYTNDCTDDNDLLIVSGKVDQFDFCSVMSTTGAVDLVVSLDGSNYSLSALSLQDHGATSTSPVLVTAADRLYVFPVTFRRIKVFQNGATDAAVSLYCRKYKSR